MSGAVSFVLGLLGLGASGAVSAGQSMSDKKRASQLPSAGTRIAKHFKCVSVCTKNGCHFMVVD